MFRQAFVGCAERREGSARFYDGDLLSGEKSQSAQPGVHVRLRLSDS